MISTCSTFQSCRLNISDDLQRQGKCNDSCTRLVDPYWYLQLLQMTDHNLLYFWLSLRNLTLPHKASKYHLLCKKKKKKIVNSNQRNYTIENYLHIASIIIILNNGYLILKIYVMYQVMMYQTMYVSCIRFSKCKGHVMLTVQLTVKYVQQLPLSIYPLNSSFH